ncbi:nuclear pore complex protein Nup98-Nup96 isoform X1 [Octopus bimaculoides]|nr:nuclear pore complex protein Nup98-Nup96 isoform X1 [Octopus bimaculoides]XP_052829629.1 nuclear pore complex protein Nup98-Nup96 isoform X1 [Octopus bimaculoides]
MFTKLSGFGFGDSSNFGNTTAFAQNFGAPTAFNTQNTSSSLFGSPATTTSGGLFGQPATFGQQSTGFSFSNTPSTSGGLFGQQPASSLFSQPASNAFSTKTPISSFAFGTNTANTNLFNRNQTPATIFGQSSNMFGGSTATGTSTKFQPPVGQDTMVKGGITNNINTRHQCISAMKEYEDKCLEELRLEDYQAGRKGKQQQQSLAQPQPQQPTSSNLFGTSTSQATTGFGFGQNKTATTTGFGNARGNTSLFNQNRAPLTSTGLFGQQTKPLFANPTDSLNTGFSFNLNPNTGSSLFGQNQQQNKSLFSNTSQQSNLFSTTTNTPTFGTGTTGFATNQTSGGLFGNKQIPFSTPSTNTGFQLQNTGNNPFNKPATITPFPFGSNSSTGVFGNTNFGFGGSGFGTSTGTSIFNNKPFGTNNALNQSTNFNFPNTGAIPLGNQPKHFGLTLGASSAGLGSTFNNTGSGFNPGGNTSTLGSHALSLSGSTSEQGNLQQHLKLLTHNPYGDSTLFMNLNDSKIKTEDVLKPTNPTAQKAVLSSHYKVGTRPLARAKPKSLLPLISKKKMQIFDGLDEEDEFGFNGEDFSLKRNIKKLVVKNLSTSAKTSFNSNTKTNSWLSSNTVSFNSSEKVIINSNGKDEENNTSDGTQISSCTELNEKENESVDSNQNSTQDNFNNNETEYEYSNVPPHPANIVLMRPGYYTVPSWQELTDITDENGDCIVEDFTIGREGYGSVFFPGPTNIAGMNFDEIVHFRKKEVTVYPDDIMKPEIGQGLNKRAEITLDCVWPLDKTTKTIISSPERLKVMNYEKRLENATINLGGQFLDYRPETGSWVFEVKHFSKYGLKDDDSEDDQPRDVTKAMKELHQRNLAVQKQRLPPNSATNGDTNLNVPQAFTKRDMLEINDSDSAMQSTSQLPVNGLITEDDAEMSDLIGFDYSQKSFEVEPMENAEPAETFPHNLVLEIGVNSNNIQMMKASFFGDAENENVNENVDLRKKSVITPIITSEKSSNHKPHLKRKDYIKLQKHTQSTKISDISRPKMDVLEVTKLLSKSSQYSAVGMNFRKCTLCASSSVLQETKSPMEITSLRNYSFRVGWGPNWSFVHVGPPISEVKAATPGNNFSILSAMGKTVSKNCIVSIEKVNVSSYLTNDDQSVKSQQKWMLENQLSNSVSSKEYINPHFTPEYGIEALCKYAECAAQDDRNMASHPDYQQIHHMKICWDLCVALWGKPIELDRGTANISEYEYHQARKEAFSRWLAETEAETIANEIEKNSTKENGNLLSITSHLSGRQIQEACMLAIKNEDNYLALLLAQASGFSKTYKHFMQLQLQNYNQLAGAHISKERLKIFGLLAGEMIFETCGQQINVCENMNWKRALGLHLWYACSPTSVIFEALKRYDAAQMGQSQCGKYARSPVPSYLENDDTDCDSVKIYDTCYHLLQLYVNKAYLLEQTLSPASTTVNHLDYRLSWHLCQVLQSLQYNHLSQYQKECINHSFAAQLESLGLWEWAIFVLAHINDEKRRKAAIKETLMRHISLCQDIDYLERESFIIERFFIPKQWVHYAKAIRAQYHNMYNQMAWHLIKAEKYNKAHEIILKHIAPYAVINDEYHHLKYLLELLSPPEQSCKIENWSTEGSVYLSYINLHEALAKFKKKDVDLSQLKLMSTALLSFCPKIRNLPCRDAKDRLCISEMSKNTSNIFRIFSMLLHQNDFDFKITNRLATQIENLEIPDENMEQETCELMAF